MHADKFSESASGKAPLIASNYDTEPLTGRFPPDRAACAAPPGLNQSVGAR
jgi:hypothetical protein